MQAIAELDEDHAHVARHREQHLTQRFNVAFFLVLYLQDNDLGKTVHDQGYVRTETLFDLL